LSQKCPNCENNIKSDALFCPNCGYELNQEMITDDFEFSDDFSFTGNTNFSDDFNYSDSEEGTDEDFSYDDSLNVDDFEEKTPITDYTNDDFTVNGFDAKNELDDVQSTDDSTTEWIDDFSDSTNQDETATDFDFVNDDFSFEEGANVDEQMIEKDSKDSSASYNNSSFSFEDDFNELVGDEFSTETTPNDSQGSDNWESMDLADNMGTYVESKDDSDSDDDLFFDDFDFTQEGTAKEEQSLTDEALEEDILSDNLSDSLDEDSSDDYFDDFEDIDSDDGKNVDADVTNEFTADFDDFDASMEKTKIESDETKTNDRSLRKDSGVNDDLFFDDFDFTEDNNTIEYTIQQDDSFDAELDNALLDIDDTNDTVHIKQEGDIERETLSNDEFDFVSDFSIDESNNENNFHTESAKQENNYLDDDYGANDYINRQVKYDTIDDYDYVDREDTNVEEYQIASSTTKDNTEYGYVDDFSVDDNYPHPTTHNPYYMEEPDKNDDSSLISIIKANQTTILILIIIILLLIIIMHHI
jgi:hypothetical protein